MTVLYPTAPMRSSNDIINVLNKVLIDGYSSSLAATTFSLPVHQALILENNNTKKVFPKLYNLREEKAPKYYVDNGSTYSINIKNFMKSKNLVTKNLGIYIMPPERSIDIDTSFQYELAKYFFKRNS